MPQSVCIEQIEGYLRNRGEQDSFTVIEEGSAIEIRAQMTRLVTKEGLTVSPIRITVLERPCAVVLTMHDVHHPCGFTAFNEFPRKAGHRSSSLRPFPHTMTAEYDRPARRLDLTMVVPAVGASVTQLEFYEAMAAFIQIADRWAARVQRTREPQRDDNCESDPRDPHPGGSPGNE